MAGDGTTESEQRIRLTARTANRRVPDCLTIGTKVRIGEIDKRCLTHGAYLVPSSLSKAKQRTGNEAALFFIAPSRQVINRAFTVVHCVYYLK
jgi:hypothetical protein